MISISNQIEIRQIRYFLVLAEELHFGRAAELLSISQSALSQQIKHLEALLDTQLFDRSHKKVVLSHTGQYFQKEAKLFIQQLGISLQGLEDLKNGKKGSLRIAYVSSSMHLILPPILKAFNIRYPSVLFELEELDNKEQLEALEKGKIDIAFIRTKEVSEKIHCHLLQEEPYALLVPYDHRLNTKNFKNLNDCREENFILSPYENSQLFFKEIQQLCKPYRFQAKASHHSNHFPSIVKLVELGLGISIIPLSMVDQNNSKIRSIPLTMEDKQTKLYIAWPKNAANPSIPLFIELMQKGL